MKNHTIRRSAVGISLIIVSILVGILLVNWPAADASRHALLLSRSTTPPTIEIARLDVSHPGIGPDADARLTIDIGDEEARITAVRYVPYFVGSDAFMPDYSCAEPGAAADLTAVRGGSSNNYYVTFTRSHRSLCIYVDYEKDGLKYTHYDSLDVNTLLISDLGQTGLEKKFAVTLGDREARILAVRYVPQYAGGANSYVCAEPGAAPDTTARRSGSYPGMLVAQGEGIYLASITESHTFICLYIDYEKDGLEHTHSAALDLWPMGDNL